MGFQWRKGSTALTNFGNSGWIVLLTTNCSITLTNVQLTDSGTYRVVLTNSGNMAPVVNTTFPVLVVPAPYLRDPQVLPGGQVEMKLTGNPNQAYEIQISSNLVNWSALTTFVYTNGLMPFTDSTAVGVPNRFYRARQVP
jgi:hypothetical protein